MEENIITSVQNARVKHVVALQQKSSLRREEGLFVVEGQREIEHCIACGYEVVGVFRGEWFLDEPSGKAEREVRGERILKPWDLQRAMAMMPSVLPR